MTRGSASSAGIAGGPTRRPLWKQILRDLESRLERGEFTSGFPGELSLVDEYRVSRGTIRAALRPLRESGRVSADRGRRPRVNQSDETSSFGPIYSLFETVRDTGVQQISTVLNQELTTNPAAADRLSLVPQAELFYLRRIRMADNQPLAVDSVWMPASSTRALLQIDFGNTALYQELRETCGITLDAGSEQLWSVGAEADVALLLKCEIGAPLFKMHRVAVHRAAPVEFRETFIRGAGYSISRNFNTTSRHDPSVSV